MKTKQLLKKMGRVGAYMFKRKGFFTKKLVVSTLSFLMMLYVDIQCQIWEGMGIILLVLLFVYVLGNYIIRYIELKREDEELNDKKKIENSQTTSCNNQDLSEDIIDS